MKISERIRPGIDAAEWVCVDVGKLEASYDALSQQLESLKVNHKAELVMRDQNSQMYLDNTRQQLAESQAREKVLRDALEWVNSRFADVSTSVVIREALAMPSDSTTLDAAIRKKQ